jgi:hypothetical protein
MLLMAATTQSSTLTFEPDGSGYGFSVLRNGAVIAGIQPVFQTNRSGLRVRVGWITTDVAGNRIGRPWTHIRNARKHILEVVPS